MKKITINLREEFKALEYIIQKNDIFKDQYDLAEKYLKDIISVNGSLLLDDDITTCVNNVIAFTGERGQGKTSAMQTFVKYVVTSDMSCLKLDVVDPSTFENMHNVVEVIVTKMYNKIQKRESELKNTLLSSQKNNTDNQTYFKILEQFQKVYESLALVRNPDKFDDLEQDYEGTIQKISRAGDSARLKEHMYELVKSYLSFEGCENGFLIIPIDDLDINISLAYKMAEQIRKYLIIPNVIIIMAVKIEQLKYCVELQFRKEMKELLEAENRLNKQEPIDMAAKYVDKLIPDGRKIALPELRLLKDTDIYYMDGDQNLLSRYVGSGIETAVLGYIYNKTGLNFIKTEGQIHPIIPNTLRELVNLISVLGKMDQSNKSQNIKNFEDYFLNTWIPNNLDEGYSESLEKLHNANPMLMNTVMYQILLDKLDNLKLFTLDTKYVAAPVKVTDNLKRYFINKQTNEISLGDTISLINFFEKYFEDSEAKLFAFALKTLYSITMLKMKPGTNNELYEFIRGSIWGHEIDFSDKDYKGLPRIESCISRTNTDKISRTYFKFIAKDLLSIPESSISGKGRYLSENVLENIKNDTISDMLFFSDFNPTFIKGNWQFDLFPTFDLENIFVSALFPQCIQQKLSRDFLGVELTYEDFNKHLDLELICEVVSNVELSEYVFKFISSDINYLRKRAERDVDHIEKLIDNINSALNSSSLGGKNKNQHSIYKGNVGKSWLLEMYNRFWQNRLQVGISDRNEYETIQIKIENLIKHKLGRVCSLHSFDLRFKYINDFLADYPQMQWDRIRPLLNDLSRNRENEAKLGTRNVSWETKDMYNSLIDEITMMLNNYLNEDR